MSNSELPEVLERLIDAHSVRIILEAIAEVCGEKAEHIRTNWQSKELARDWDDAGTAVSKAAAKVRTP